MSQYTDSTGITWNYTLDANNNASIGTDAAWGHGIATTLGSSLSGAITIPSTVGGYTVTTIGSQAFSSCSGLTSIDLSGTQVETIGPKAFRDCTGLTSITISDSLTSIGSYAFWTCSDLTSIDLGDSVTTIGPFAFFNCTSLTSFDLGNSLTTIGSQIFRNCTSLTSITVDANNNSFSDINGVLFNKDQSTLIKYPLAKTATSYAIPHSVTTIGIQTFDGCFELTSIDLGDSVTTIDPFAFYNCSSLTSITVDANNNSFSDINGVLFNKDQSVLIQYPEGNTAASYAIPHSVTTIGSYAFYYCSSLTSITISDSVTTIGDYAFFMCSDLNSITIPDSVTTIDVRAFYNIGSPSTVYVKDVDPTDEHTMATLQNTMAGRITGDVTYEQWVDAIPPPANICFPAGTPVLTDQGEIDIDKIDPEKHTICANKIEGITKTTSIENYVVMIKKDAFSRNVPCRDTTMSANHKIMFNNQMVHARDFVDKNIHPDNIYKIPYSGETLYNVLLETKHDLMIVNNLIAETLSPTSVNAWLFRKLKSDISNAERKEVMDAYMQRVFTAPVLSLSSFMIGCK